MLAQSFQSRALPSRHQTGDPTLVAAVQDPRQAGAGPGYITQHLVLCVRGSLNRSLCLGRYFSR